MGSDEDLKRDERELWERFALKAVEFVPVKKSGAVYDPQQLAERAAQIATNIVRERRDAFNELGLWEDEEDKPEPKADGFTADEQRKIEEWHESPSAMPIWSHLGMTREQYAAKVEGGKDEPARAAPKRQEQSAGASSTTPAQRGFDEGLVERLARVAWESDARNDGLPWRLVNDGAKENLRNNARAILSEFAKTPCELPTADEIAQAWNSNAPHAPKVSVLHMLRARLAPILAAKDAEIARMSTDIRRMNAEWFEQKRRLAELESRAPANECTNAERQQYELTIEQQRKRIEELDNLRVDADEKHAVAQWYISSLEKWKEDNKRFTDEWHEAIDVLCELWPRDEPIEANPPQGDWIRRLVAVREKRAVAELEKELADVRTTEQERRLEIASHRGIVAELEKRLADSEASRKAADAMVDARQKRIQELEKCLAEATAVPTVDGKTPGRVLYDELWKQLSSGNEEMFRMEAGAKAVLRAFGGQALRRVRERIDVTERMSNDTEYGKEWIHRGETLAIINDELAKLGGQTGTPCSECKGSGKSMLDYACGKCGGDGVAR